MSDFFFYLAWLVLCGPIVGLALSALSRARPLLGRWFVWLPGVVILTPVLGQVGIMLSEAFRYSGHCQGWKMRQSHPCDLTEYLLQDWLFGLIFFALPIALGVLAAIVCFLATRPPAAPRGFQ